MTKERVRWRMNEVKTLWHGSAPTGVAGLLDRSSRPLTLLSQMHGDSPLSTDRSVRRE